ncbi:MAG: fructose-bisphosphate aldolase, class I [Microgenomates group bacterium Gr01-1014_16]|nr:MAG: fructose-bisphosphate aldolase, class I [Microgenomates group bacterium Gr01-1014_16]
MNDLVIIAKKLVAEGKGVLAADWGVGSIGTRFEKIGLENTPENRKRYREMLFGTLGLSEYISGVIEFDETIRQGLAEVLKKNGIMPGIKVDKGLVDMANFPGEKVSEGLNGLRERLKEYVGMGAVFCKWRMVVTIGGELPTRACVETNARAMAQYAALCQEQGLVPIVEPEVLKEGDHTIEKAAEVTEETLRLVFEMLGDHKVKLEGMILKSSMAVCSGTGCPVQANPEMVAEKTVEVLRRVVPPAVPGVVFLSGGQEAIEATINLNLIGQIRSLPWRLTFSYERALEEPTLFAWGGKDENVEKAQKVLLHRAKMNSLASLGKYTEEAENEI